MFTVGGNIMFKHIIMNMQNKTTHNTSNVVKNMISNVIHKSSLSICFND